MEGVGLEEVVTYKYLGLIIDNELSFKPHVKMITKQVAHKISLLGKLRIMLTEFAAKSVYKSMIMSLYDIGDVFYCTTNKAHLCKLQTLQNRALRVIYKLGNRENTDSNHDKMGIMKLESRRKLHTIQLASWLATQEQYRDLSTLSTRAHSVGRRNLKLERINKSQYQKSFLHQAGILWNDLPTEIHCIKDQEKLKKEIK